MHVLVVNGLRTLHFCSRYNVNVKAVFSNGISNLVNEGKHVFALVSHGNLILVYLKWSFKTVISLDIFM